MTRSLKTWMCVATGGVIVLGTALPVFAADENPYQSIIDRNVFGVKPPPPPDPNAEEANKPPPPNITLTGIITLGGKRVLMETPPPPAKPGEQPKKGSFIMREGEIEGDIEVLSIDEVNGVVRVKNGGKEVSLNFKDNGPKIVAAAPTGPQPGLPGALPVPRPGMAQPGMAPGMATPNPAAYPRTLRLPQTQPGTTATPAAMPGYTPTSAVGSPATGTGVPGALGVPGAPMPALGVPAGNNTLTKWPPEQSDLTAEQQRAMIEVMRQKYAAEGNRAALLLPGGSSPTQPNPQNPQQVPVPVPGPRVPGF